MTFMTTCKLKLKAKKLPKLFHREITPLFNSVGFSLSAKNNSEESKNADLNQFNVLNEQN